MRILPLRIGLFLGCLLCSAVGWAQHLSQNEVEQALDMPLRVAFEEAGTGLHAVTIMHRGGLELPGDGMVSWVLGVDVANLEPGRHTLPVTVLVGGKLFTETRVQVTLKQRVQTPMLRRRMKRGEQVSRADVQMRDVVLARPVPGRIREIDDVVGMVAKRSLRDGRPLIDRWFEAPFVVDRGDRLRVKLVRGGLKIETTGVALQRGRVGDLVSVRNPRSRSRYEVRITAPGEARVQAW